MVNVSLVFASIELFCCEAVLFLVALGGFWWLSSCVVRRLRVFPSVTGAQLVRFARFQTVFVAAWSVLFKLGIPPVAVDRVVLDRGPSQIYANAAELFFVLFVMAGLYLVFRGRMRRG